MNNRTRTAPGRLGWLASFATALAILTAFGAGAARAENRTIDLFYVHTGERAQFTFKKNGRYDAAVLKKLNVFLRDWRRNEPTRMDPALFDVVWEVYQKSGATKPITVVSAYRSPATNNMLRRRTRGVAKNSQHTYGRAMDFFIAGVPTSKLRAIALKLGHGGVGYYPTANTPFVHLDVGSVRHWPRMSRSQLMALFPDGRTLHMPPDNKPLPGYELAVADYQRYKSGKSPTAVASSSGGSSSYQVVGDRGGVIRPPPGASKNLLSFLFGGGADEDEDNNDAGIGGGGGDDDSAPVQVASAAPAKPAKAATTRTTASAELRATPGTNPTSLPGVASAEDDDAPAAPVRRTTAAAPAPVPVAVVPPAQPERPAEEPAPALVVPATLPPAKAEPPAPPADAPTVVATLQVTPLPKPVLAVPASPVATDPKPEVVEIAAVRMPVPAPDRPAPAEPATEIALAALPLAKPSDLVASRGEIGPPVLGYASAGGYYNPALASAGPVDVLAETARGILRPRNSQRPAKLAAASASPAIEESGDGVSSFGLEPMADVLLAEASTDPFADDLVAPRRDEPMLITGTVTVRAMTFAMFVAPDVRATPEMLVAAPLPTGGELYARVIPGPRSDRFMVTDADRLMMTASLP